jgi:hypothetical protein
MHRPLEKTITNDDSRSCTSGRVSNCMHMHRCLRIPVYALAGPLNRAHLRRVYGSVS